MDQKCFSLTIKVSDKCPSTSPSAVPVKLDLFIHSPGISTPAKQIRHQVPGPQSTKPSLWVGIFSPSRDLTPLRFTNLRYILEWFISILPKSSSNSLPPECNPNSLYPALDVLFLMQPRSFIQRSPRSFILNVTQIIVYLLTQSHLMLTVLISPYRYAL